MTYCCNSLLSFIPYSTFACIGSGVSGSQSIVVKICESATDNRYLILHNQKFQKIFQHNETISPGVTRSYAHISCDPNTGIIRNPERLGDSIRDTANIFIYRTVNLQNISSFNQQHQQSSWFPVSVNRLVRKTHLWYIYTTPDFSDYALRVLIETERELNNDVIAPNQWGTFVCEKIKVIRNDYGFWFAYRWLQLYNRRHFSNFYSYWRLLWNQPPSITVASNTGNTSNV